MAVQKLKLITVRGGTDRLEEALDLCLAQSEFHIENAADVIKRKSGMTTFNEINRFAPLITETDNLAGQAGIRLADAPPAATTPEDAKASLDGLREEYASLSEARDKLSGLIYDDERIIEQLVHVEGANADLDSLFSFEFFKIRFGHMPRESYENLQRYTSDLDKFFFFASSVEKTEVWGLYIAPKSKEDRVDALFASLHFERIYLSERAHGTPAEARQNLRTEIEHSRNKLAGLDEKLAALRGRMKTELSALRAYLARMNGTFELKRRALYSESGFTLTGWIPARAAAAFCESLEALGGISSVAEDPSPDGTLQPPTLLKNCRLFKPFEEFVTMYGLPSYNELDPTPLVAITYMLFFGLMFGDVGQGAVIILAGFLMYKLRGMFIGRILMRVGVVSMLFGVFYGSVFGYEDIIHGFNPMANINTTLFAAVGIGAVMITVAMVLNIVNARRQHDKGKLLLSQNGVAGIIFYWSVLLIVVGMFGLAPFSVPTKLVVALIVVAVTAIFLRVPLGDLLARRKNWMPEKKLDFFLESFFELFEVVLSFVTNTISFIRIGAFALNHVGMMTVIFLLAQTAAGGQNPAVVVIGNIFIIGFEGMIVCIQALRLEFYELFGRFFEGDGREFEPAAKLGTGR